MGQFSWLDCVDETQVLDNTRADVYVLVPKEFVGTYGERIHETCYDGYGHFGKYDIFDLVALWNKKYINPYTFSSRAYRKPTRDMYGTKEYYDAAVLRYKWECEMLRDFCSGMTHEDMIVKYGESYRRNIGINIACYDEDNASLRYPIKITHRADKTYEFCAPSLSDPNQGWPPDPDDDDDDDFC